MAMRRRQMPPFHKFLRAERKAAGKTSREVAALLGLSESHYCRIEKGERPYQLWYAVAVAEFLQIPIGRLAGETDNEEPQQAA